MSDVVDAHRKAVEAFSARVGAAAGKWDSPSPCEGWTARDIVEHVVGNHQRLAARLGAPEPEATGDLAADWIAARDAALGALAGADLDAVVDGPFGPMRGSAICQIMTNDTLIHTWDLARAVGADDTLPGDLVEVAYAGMVQVDEFIRRPGFFGPKVEIAEDAPLQDRFIAFVGRQP